MGSPKTIGRIVGILLFAQFLGLMCGFVLLVPITTPAVLENAAGVSSQIRAATSVLLVTGALTIALSIYVYPLFREHRSRMALWLLVLSAIWFAMQAVDNQHILSLMSLSQQYVAASGSNAEFFRLLVDAARAERRWAHYTELLVMDVWYFSFYLILFRSALIPRALAAFALATVMVHAAGLPLPVLLGYPQLLVLAYSLLLSYLVVGTWLVVKGFEADRSMQGET